MHRSSRSRNRLGLIATAAFAVVGAMASVVSAPAAHAADPVTINLLGINDFHGRIDPNITVRWAWEIEHLRDQTVTPSDGGLLVGAGDLVGASLFNSAVADDQPTIDVMNEIGLDASSVGNHEFDKGWDDLKNRILGGDVNNPTNASWNYLGANVYSKGTTDPVLPAYETYDVGGITVGVIGAVTQETSSLVSPGGIADLTFGPVVPAINRVAGELSDGDTTNGEADVIVAVVHAGAVDGTKGYDEEVAQGGEFADMANNLDPEVNVVFQGHTHQKYVYDAPVTGGDTATRPMLQTGSYGSNIGQVVLTVDPTTKHVTGYTARNNAIPTDDNSTLIAQYPDVLNPINTTVTNAVTNGNSVGNQAVGSITSDITTAFTGGSYVDGTYTGGTRDDRASESTMGDLVANALRDGLPADMGHADLGITNPGGLRAEFYYAGDTVNGGPNNTDGVVTYAEANNVLPFVNNIWTVDLTGSDLEQVLEEQWQPAGASRPYLNLGLSDNVQVTLDPSQPEGQRVTSVRINGKRLDPDKTYTVCTFSFLGTGGDNFSAFTNGTPHDTGLVDRDLWIGYLKSHPGLGPDFARQEVDESGMPSYVAGGDHLSFSLSKLDLTSLGSPANQTVEVYARTAQGRDHLGSFPVTDGSATVEMDVPADIPANSALTVIAMPSGTTLGKTDAVSSLQAEAPTMTYGTPGTVHVAVDPAEATGHVTVLDGTRKLGTGTIDGGQADVTIPGTALGPGHHGLTVSYAGDSTNTGASTAVDLRVTKATPTMKVHHWPARVHADRTHVKLVVKLRSPGHIVTGPVSVRTGGRTYLARLSDGKVMLRLHTYTTTGKKHVAVRYLGSAVDRSVRKTFTIRVVR
ncbi:MAG TPA: 5'-nucleotidase C-terminal domain-containing protein [Nocardioides sp.]|uniref:5'-nucleotidase C-terminal domain-containing protein n=1 Tax=Nocardioides sp. TaxID=35761 RepID=UPI002F3EE4C4